MMRGRATFAATTPSASPASSPSSSSSSAFPFPSSPNPAHSHHYRPPGLDFSSLPGGVDHDAPRSPSKVRGPRPAGFIRAYHFARRLFGWRADSGFVLSGSGDFGKGHHRARGDSVSSFGSQSASGARLVGLGLLATPVRRLSLTGDINVKRRNDDDDREGYMKPKKARRNRLLLGLLFLLVIYLTLGRGHLWISSGDRPSPGASRRVPSPRHRRTKLALIDGASNTRLPELYEYDDISDDQTRPPPQRAPLPPYVAEHHTLKNGLFQPNMSALHHPLYQLIHESRAAWDDKVKRQSRSLAEAVIEYRRRYKMEPPRGFDKWWAFVVENNIELPDEYDRIHLDMAPFRAYSPSAIAQHIEDASTMADTFILRVKRGVVRLMTAHEREDFGQASMDGAQERMDGQLSMLREVARWIPDMTAVWGLHDTPQIIIAHDHRRELQDFYEDGEYYEETGNIDTSLRGLAYACANESPMRFPSPPPRGNPHTFIANHLSTMDLCQHPRDVGLHGLVAGRNPHMTSLIPLFSLSKTALHADIVGVPDEKWASDTGAVGVEMGDDGKVKIDLDKSGGVLPTYIPWGWKSFDQIMWRGTNTGSLYRKDAEPWWNSHRIRLVRMANSLDSKLETLSRPSEMLEGQRVKEGLKVRKGDEIRGEEGGMDIQFAGAPLQCDEADGTCDEIREEFKFVEYMVAEESLKYKYVIDVDGNAWSARFQRLMLSGSLVFKSTITPEWWTDRIQPWVHYIPVQVSYSDLDDILGFFRDTGGDALAEQIATEGRDWALTHWRRVDMVAYTFRLYLEWARVSSKHRSKMDFKYHESMEMFRE